MSDAGKENAVEASRTFLHDFEPTFQSYLDEESHSHEEAHLLGLLNFAVLWHEEVYINDTALGDNRHLLRSFWIDSDTGLFSALQEYIHLDTVKCMLRDKVAIGEDILVESEPTLTDISHGWDLRGEGSRELFLTPESGELRDSYNSYVDDLFEQKPEAVVRYNPDDVKPRFREFIRAQLAAHSDLTELLGRLPPETVSKYKKVCHESEYFTNADLWALIHHRSDAKDLVLAQGHLNQLCVADAVRAGMTGSDHSSLSLERFNLRALTGSPDEPKAPPITFDELREEADVNLLAPSLELLSLLTPDQVISLREGPGKKYFRTQSSSFDDFATYRKRALDEVEEYWNQVCEFIQKKFPKDSLQLQTRLAVVVERLSTSRRVVKDVRDALRVTVWGRPLVALAVPPVDLALTIMSPAKPYLQRLGFHLFYERNDAIREARRSIRPDVWLVEDTWATNRRLEAPTATAIRGDERDS